MKTYPTSPDFFYLALYGGGSFISTFLVFRFLSPALSRAFTTTYGKLTRYQQAEWNDRVLSNTHAVVCNVLTAYSLLFVEGMRVDPIWYDSSAARAAVSITIGYMLGDLVCMAIWCNTNIAEFLAFIAHHLATTYAYYFVSVDGVLCWFAMFRMLSEFSNYNMNQRWFFDIMGVPRTDLKVLINGAGLFVTFFLCRILAMPFFWHAIFSSLQTDTVRPLGHLQYTVMIIPSVILDSLNLYWFYKISRGLMKALSANRSMNKQNKQE